MTCVTPSNVPFSAQSSAIKIWGQDFGPFHLQNPYILRDTFPHPDLTHLENLRKSSRNCPGGDRWGVPTTVRWGKNGIIMMIALVSAILTSSALAKTDRLLGDKWVRDNGIPFLRSTWMFKTRNYWPPYVKSLEDFGVCNAIAELVGEVSLFRCIKWKLGLIITLEIGISFPSNINS